jgi:DNA polymerase-1
MKSVYIVDASAMFFRAFYAVRPLSNSKGLPTNALYGYLQMIIKLLKEVKPDYMIFCFDRKEPSFRKDLYAEYKANRSEMPEDLVPQIPYIRRLTEVLGIPTIDKLGFEADDLIGTFAKKGEAEKYDVVIVSGDKDFAQLISPKIIMYDTMKEIKYTVPVAIEKWGVAPEHMVDYLALVGDSSDNIPGVKGIGPKGAQKLIAEFGNLENIYENISKVKNDKLREKLIEHKEMAILSKTLVTIKCDVETGLEISDMKLKTINQQEAHQIFEELEFKSFEKKLFGDGEAVKGQSLENKSTDSEAPNSSFKEIIATLALLKEIPDASEVWAFTTSRGHFLGFGDQIFELDPELKRLRDVLGGKSFRWKGFDLKGFWRKLGIDRIQQINWDSHLAAYIVRSGQNEEFEKLYNLYVGRTLPEFATASDMYASHQKLEEILRIRLQETVGEAVYYNIELPLVPILAQMENHGVLIDTKLLGDLSVQLTGEIKALESKIHELAGEPFNVASPKQLATVLFDKLKLPVIKKTKTGPSTDSSVLEKLKEKHEIAQEIENFRELSKLKSTYVDALPELADSETKRVHTYFNQTVATTGRLSSTNPNLQNIPIRTERGREIRKAFIAPPGCTLLAADYSQIELRLLAHFTGDPGLTQAFKDGLDVHSATASEVFNVKLSEVTKDQRRIAKAVNFGLAYGQGVFGLAESLGIEKSESKAIIERYFQKFSKVKDYMFDTIESAKKNGYVETIFGRRRYLPELSSSNGMIKKFGERAAINAPLQGSASDIVKKAMIDIFGKTKGTMVLQVHDELVFETPFANLESDKKIIREKMENVIQISVPLVADLSNGQNWDEC